MMTLEAMREDYLRVLVRTSEPIPGEPVAAQFERVFSALSCSMRIAETPQQRAFARDNYCERARALVKRLPPTERGATGLTHMTSHCSPYGHTLESVPITTEAVETYCQAP